MNRKRSSKFFVIHYVSVDVLLFVVLINGCNAGFNISPAVRQEHIQDVNSITKSLLFDYNRLMKRQQGRDYSDNEEISELSRLQDAQMGATTTEGADTQASFNSPGNVQVPTDQNQPSLDALNNITDFLKAKEMSITDPVDGGFTQWTSWSSCPEACGRTALRSRERYCTNPAPANGGKNCEGPRFQLKLCKIKQCAVDGGYSSWSEWSSCSQKCGQGMKKRRRHCNNPKPKNGGKQCKGARKQAKPCYGRICQDQDSIVDIDPQTVCGYNPCVVAKCIILPYATCVSDFKCRPVFFDSEERKVTQCRGDNLYLNVDPQTVCRFNPCKYTTCLNGAAAKCVINTRCHPVFLDAFGKVIKCKARDHAIKEQEQEQEQDEEQEDGDEEDDADRLNKLMSSKLGIIDKENDDDDGDDGEADDKDTEKDSSDEDRGKVVKSKLPSRFRLTTNKGLKKEKANRFRHGTNSKHGRLKHRRWSKG